METKEILGFIGYVDSFYNPFTGIYPIKGASVEVIANAIQAYLDSLSDDRTWGGGDSIDRERVRDIILESVTA